MLQIFDLLRYPHGSHHNVRRYSRSAAAIASPAGTRARTPACVRLSTMADDIDGMSVPGGCVRESVVVGRIRNSVRPAARAMWEPGLSCGCMVRRGRRTRVARSPVAWPRRPTAIVPVTVGRSPAGRGQPPAGHPVSPPCRVWRLQRNTESRWSMSSVGRGW